MPHKPITDNGFLAKLVIWLSEDVDILMLTRYRRGAGAREYELYRKYDDLLIRFGKLPSGACVTMFKNVDFTLRGVVDDSFIDQCLKKVPNGSEYLVIELVPTIAGKMTWFHYGSGVSHKELIDDLSQSRMVLVAVGLHPSMTENSDQVMDAVVPDADGTVRAGPY